MSILISIQKKIDGIADLDKHPKWGRKAGQALDPPSDVTRTALGFQRCIWTRMGCLLYITTCSLGDQLAAEVTDSGRVSTLLDCLSAIDRPALFSPDMTRPPLTHTELHHFISHFALPTSGLHPRLGPNDRIMIALPTGPENALALMAIASYHTGAPVNYSCTASELSEDAARLKAKAVVTTIEAAERLELKSLRAELGAEIIFVHARLLGSAGLFDMSFMDDRYDESTWEDVQLVLPSPSKLHGLDDQSLVLHTSGTSGKKKVVPYSLRCLIVGTCCVAKSWDLSSKDVNMNMMPLFHVGGIIRNLWAPMFSGGSAIMCAGFDDLAFWPIVMERGATWYYAAPTMHHAILGSKPPSVVPATDTRIRMIANAAGGLLPTLAQQLKAAFGAVILPSYGMTECMPIASPPTNYKLDRPGCSGIACGPFMSIRDPFNLERELPCGATGAVSFRGLPTFEGYEKAIGEPLDTSSFSSEGWFDGGDVGFMDTDGYLFITGRSKEIINKGGEVISPFEIEEAITSLAKHRVKSTIAFSVEHDVLQETIGVVIVPIPGAPRIGLAELLDILKVQLHPSKWPFVIVYMDDLPKNNAGKPLRIKLASRLGISQMTDNTPAIMRYFEATAPDKNVPLSEPIPCSRVSPDVDELTHAVLEIPGVQEVAVRLQKDGSPEALVSVTPMSELDVYSILYALTQAIPGYSMPDPLYVFQNLLERRSDDEVDWEYMETEIKRRNASSMSSGAIAVRDIVAHLLDKDPGTIAGDSDFFLIGGNSLLLGRLAHKIRTEIGVTLKVSDIFTSSTINGISELVDAESSGTVLNKRASANSEKSAVHRCSVSVAGSEESWSTRGRPQTHPLVLIVQALPMVFFHPMKTTLTWTTLLYLLSRFSNFVSISYWERVGALLVAIICARLLARIVCPITAIIFKWIVIGRYKPGVYRYWSNYHLRWWITNQFIRIAGRGIFSSHPKLEFLYFRALGAHIGKNVRIDKSARLSELDLLTFKDGCRVDKAVVRGFCIERDGYFRLDPIIIGRNAAVNTYTQISPGAIVPDGAIYGPHASSHDEPSPDDYVTINRTENPEPHWLLKVFVAGPIIFVVLFASYLPWFAALFGLLTQTIPNNGLTNLESIIKWFASPSRIAWHTLARVNRELFPCIIQVALSIVVKRIMGFHREGSVEQMSQWTLLKRFINGTILSQDTLKGASDVLGAHYELTSWIWRGMGAKVGKRVYWPGSGLYCPDPELLEIGDNVVFGSRSEVFTTDSIGSAKVSVGSGSMIADRVVLMPGSTVGRKTIMGSGALGKRNGQYDDGSVWMGNDCGEAVCFGKPNKDTDEITTTPFGKAFYERNATFFVYPYWMLLVTNILVGGCSAAYWAMGPVVVTQILNQMRLHLRNLSLFEKGARDIFVLFGLVATFFIITLTFMSLLVVIWVIATKWLVVGRRRDGRYDWDQSSYCQRWQLHLTLARPLHRGFDNGGILGAISGSAYYVWYLRALGAKIGKDCSMFSGGKVGLMTEPDLVQMGDNVALDDCSVVAHINSRGNFSLNSLKIGSGCALRAGSRLLSGASMDESSMLCEHTLLTSGETAVSGYAYAGWPARQVEAPLQRIVTEKSSRSKRRSRGYSQVSRVARFSMLQPLPKPETTESEESSVQKEKGDVIDMTVVSPLSLM